MPATSNPEAFERQFLYDALANPNTFSNPKPYIYPVRPKQMTTYPLVYPERPGGAGFGMDMGGHAISDNPLWWIHIFADKDAVLDDVDRLANECYALFDPRQRADGEILKQTVGDRTIGATLADSQSRPFAVNADMYPHWILEIRIFAQL